MGVRSKTAGISAGVMGLAMAMFYAGFVAGIPAMTKVHEHLSRRTLFVLCTLLMAAGSLGYGLMINPLAWLVLRFVTGFCIAGCYLVVETWLNDIAHNEIRGKVMGTYVAVAAAGMAVGQLVLSVVNPSSWVPFGIAGAIGACAFAPLLTVKVGGSQRHCSSDTVSLAQMARMVPSGIVGFVLVGVTQGCLLQMAAVYAARADLSSSQVALFVGAITTGAAPTQRSRPFHRQMKINPPAAITRNAVFIGGTCTCA